MYVEQINMASELVLNAFALNGHLQKILRIFPHYFLCWDTITGRFKYELGRKSYAVWHLTGALLTGILWPLSCFYLLILKGLHDSRSTEYARYDQLFVVALLLLGSVTVSSLTFTLHMHRVELTNYFNKILTLRNESKSVKTVSTRSTSLSKTLWLIHNGKQKS